MKDKYKSLYEVTGRIEDVATFLVPISDLPPQRKPLTDEQRLAIEEKQKFPPMCDPYIYWFFKGVDACEAAHGIKE